MIQIWKETLLPGTQVDHKTKRTFTITSTDVRAGERNINRMVRKGRNIPLVFEHLDVEECDPEEWKANYARNTFGKVGGARLSTADDVAAGVATKPGTLLVRHDIYDEDSAQAVRRAGYVSPKIYRGYLDSQGEEYSGLTVAHIAATPTACQFWQKPFELSESDALYLSYTPDEPNSEKISADENSEPCPRQDWFDAWLDSTEEVEPDTAQAVELSSTEDPDEGDIVADDNDSDDKKKAPPKDDKGGGGGNGKKTLEDCIKALREGGMNIPDGVSDPHELWIAIKAQPSAGEPDPIDDEPPAPVADDTTPAAGGPPMLMSTTDTDSRKRERARKYAAPERADLSARINQLLKDKRVTPPECRRLLRRAGAVEMSFTKTFEPAGDDWKQLVGEVDALEKRKPGETQSIDLSTTETVNRPKLGDAPMTAERGAAVAEGILGMRDLKTL